MNTSHTTYPDYSFVSFLQHLITALGRLQIQEFSPIGESLHVYGLVDQRTLSTSCSIATMLGYTADAIHEMSAVGLDNLIHPDGLNLVSDHYQRFATLRSNDVMMTNYRMKRADGAWCWLHSQETPLLAAIDGFPLQILGSVRLLPHLLACSPED